ncbi:MAG: ATP-binding protein [Anaerolineales bacterium]|nr:ATP-binding protein [Anaerolineales bacterium]
MPGVGKTALAATLARQASPLDKIFWHTFYQGEDLRSVIWKLARFLAWQGKGDVWRLLQRTGADQALPPLNSLLDYLLQQAKDENYLLCLDDFHLLYDDRHDDPELLEMMERVVAAAAAGSFRMILVSRSSSRVMVRLRNATRRALKIRYVGVSAATRPPPPRTVHCGLVP